MTELVQLRSGEAEVARKALERTVARGGVAVFPSDGLYGLACDPLDAGAIARIHRLKGRDDGKPSAVMYFSPLAIRELVSEPRPADQSCRQRPDARSGHAGLRQSAATLPARLPARTPNGSGIRLIGGPLAGTMCPVFQTSANLSGEPAPARFEDVPTSIRDGADLAIDGGELPGLPSTVVDLAVDRGRRHLEDPPRRRPLAGRPGEQARLGRPRIG